jgi:hypothetical protein
MRRGFFLSVLDGSEAIGGFDRGQYGVVCFAGLPILSGVGSAPAQLR